MRSNEELLRQGECPQPNCIEAAGHTGPCSGDLSYDALCAEVARLEAEAAPLRAALGTAAADAHGLAFLRSDMRHDHSKDFADCRNPTCVGRRAALSSDAGRGWDAETAKIFIEGIVAEHEDRHPSGD